MILAEFGNQRHPDFPDVDTDPDTPGPTTFEGPLHNKIPEPDRTKDNSTVWQSDFNRQHYQDLYFKNEGRVAQDLLRDAVVGPLLGRRQVSDWVKVPYNEARYGREDATTWNLIQDARHAWVAQQNAAGKTDAQIKTAMQEYDKYDRYDFDGDGDFNEPDGYIDHFQIVHAGGDEADGDPQQGEDAIWSHRWYAFLTDAGFTGPADNPLGGTADRRHRHLGRRLHGPARERWPVGLRPRVRPRPRSARRVRHVRAAATTPTSTGP